MNLVAPVSNCIRTHFVVVKVMTSQFFFEWSKHVVTNRNSRVGVAMFSNEFCLIFLRLVQLCVVERCQRAESLFVWACLAFSVDRPVLLHQQCKGVYGAHFPLTLGHMNLFLLAIDLAPWKRCCSEFCITSKISAGCTLPASFHHTSSKICMYTKTLHYSLHLESEREKSMVRIWFALAIPTGLSKT